MATNRCNFFLLLGNLDWKFSDESEQTIAANSERGKCVVLKRTVFSSANHTEIIHIKIDGKTIHKTTVEFKRLSSQLYQKALSCARANCIEALRRNEEEQLGKILEEL